MPDHASPGVQTVEGLCPFEDGLRGAGDDACEEAPDGGVDQSSLIVITSSHRRQWVTALEELTKRRVRIAVVLVDGRSFGSVFHTLDVVPHLYDAGVTPYAVSMRDDMAEAMRRPHTAAVPGVSEESVKAAARR